MNMNTSAMPTQTPDSHVPTKSLSHPPTSNLSALALSTSPTSIPTASPSANAVLSAASSSAPTSATSFHPTTAFALPPTASQTKDSQLERVSHDICFSLLDYASFTDSTFDGFFRSLFRYQLADAAGVSPSSVVINSISSGSTVVASTVIFSRTETEPSAATSYAAQVQSNPGALFSDPSFSDYGQVTSSSVSVGIVMSPTASPSLAPTPGPTTAPTTAPTSRCFCRK